ncbi:DNA polymerase III subunit gamma and tau [Actinoalloteichus hymeniacidonis]|uniref:DNA polymerase III subunit gamma/tau n=1 Tax=Actinoalloteichus hymeniacidonis TaxID=340345 RepID=A0AAC9HLE6_9PSEU|nr:DNA polymerase III subunit gamma and tau [Actinoalloteichus hymeniacidonis]AOS61055.1 DNA polymerase III, tau subunit [Actinoalloteichus hymeniacidonis]MBB5910945.1 DNA polymerase-3 subunit gamma/tau [Actinoalloteichus hymeniacidonis]
MALALYRKYRPATFAEVVGQEHVTDPIRTALSAGRINHAYLFSGPRGCGKTSSARILARSLNCVEGPTPDPCGTCSSCVALAPEGAGNVDVVELDAASHGGVDDARELRDRAFYAPAESRYRVFIVDEAHMVTTQGFNALLKIVEEPPEHLIFIFATTEPDKVLPTIRSRTHHYPFRLMPPATMRGLLERICAEEGVAVDPAVYPLVIKAGGGSARDTQSVLDQLLAGAGEEGVTYQRAVTLLGVTDAALIDEMVDGLATADHAAVYATVDRLADAGHDPRRFATDLLERLRDLVLLQAVPEAAQRGLVDVPADQLTVMQRQSTQLGAATLARFAEIVHSGLGEMRGATAPRLLLELLCARMLLPAVSDSEQALLQRLEQVELRMTTGIGVAPPAAAPRAEAASPAPAVRAPAAQATSPAQAAPAAAPRTIERPQARPPQPEPSPAQREAPAAAPQAAQTPTPPAAAPDPAPVAPEPEPVAAAPAATGGIDAAAIRRVWTALLGVVRERSRSLEAMLSDATVHAVQGNLVLLTHMSAPLARRLADSRNSEAIAAALGQVLGGSWQVRCGSAEEMAAIGGGAPAAAPKQPVRQAAPAPQAPVRPQRPAAQPAEQRPRRVDTEDADGVPLPPEPDDMEPPEPDPQSTPSAPVRRVVPAKPSEPVPTEGAAEAAGSGGSGFDRPPDPMRAAERLLTEELGVSRLRS